MPITSTAKRQKAMNNVKHILTEQKWDVLNWNQILCIENAKSGY